MTLSDGPIGILMVTGAYFPELSGGGLQCRTMIHALRDSFSFQVLTTSVDPALPRDDQDEGIPVTRVRVDVTRPLTKLTALWQIVGFFIRRRAAFAVVHLHGFSQKSVAIVLLALAFRKRLVLTIHTADHDEPAGARRYGRLAYWTYRRIHRFVAVSNRLGRNYLAAGLPPERLVVAPNAVDGHRFHPPSADERRAARQRLALDHERQWILFVGFFSRDKCPDVLFDAWRRLATRADSTSGLVFVGATDAPYHEIDPSLAPSLRHTAADHGLSARVRFIPPMTDIETAYHAADLFVMPSAREAFGMVLLEAMATALPVVASRIDGVTDDIVDDGRTGVLVPMRDPDALAEALERLLTAPAAAAEMGVQARSSAITRYGIEAAVRRWREIYQREAS